ncbi:MAG TPA: hypothetical protein PLP19_21725 [bacterium]|nr:hypothetical protein [bacterium]HPN46119.1 hypothetical protein [bacterium]
MASRTNQAKKHRIASVIPHTDNAETLKQLEALAVKAGLEIRREKGDFKSGYCRVKEQNLLILKKEDPVDKIIDIIANNLADFPIDNNDTNADIYQLIADKKSEKNSLTGSEEV